MPKSRKVDRQIAKMVNAMTTAEYIKLLDIADPCPMTAEEKAAALALSDDELLAALNS